MSEWLSAENVVGEDAEWLYSMEKDVSVERHESASAKEKVGKEGKKDGSTN